MRSTLLIEQLVNFMKAAFVMRCNLHAGLVLVVCLSTTILWGNMPPERGQLLTCEEEVLGQVDSLLTCYTDASPRGLSPSVTKAGTAADDRFRGISHHWAKARLFDQQRQFDSALHHVQHALHRAQAAGCTRIYARLRLMQARTHGKQQSPQVVSLFARLQAELPTWFAPEDTLFRRLYPEVLCLHFSAQQMFPQADRPADAGLLYEALRWYQASGNPPEATATYYSLACHLRQQGKLYAAEDWFYRTWAQSCQPDNARQRELRARSMQWLANLYAERGDSLSWRYLIEDAIALHQANGSRSVISPLLSLAEHHITFTRYALADSLLRLVAAQQSPQSFHQAQALVIDARLAAARQQPRRAVELLHTAMACDSTSQIVQLALALLPGYYHEAGNDAMAYQYQREAQAYEQRLLNQHTLLQANRLEAKLEVARQAQEAERLRHAHAMQAAQLRAQRRQLLLALLALVGLGGVLLYGYHLWRRLRHAHCDLTHAKETAEAASQAKADFLSVMSHEIRNPLHAVVSTVHLLQAGKPRRDQEDSLHALHLAAKHLLTLVNDILDYGKLEAGRLKLEHIPFDLRELVEQVRQTNLPQAQAKGLDLRVVVAPALSDWYQGDPVRIRQVLSNLVSNALKFTEAGYVEIRVEANSADELYLQVSDTGIGISSAAQQRVFEEFTQASAATTRQYGGTGLGLSICRKLLLLMGSQIELSSEVGRGSTFAFRLRIPTAEGPSPASAQAVQQEASLQGMRVLVVDDNALNLTIMERWLQRWGAEVLLATNGAEALERVEAQPPHLVLMDLHMPVMDGYEAIRRLRKLPDPHSAQLPVIALTASVLTEELQKAAHCGVQAVVRKPFEPNELLTQLEKWRPVADAPAPRCTSPQTP